MAGLNLLSRIPFEFCAKAHMYSDDKHSSCSGEVKSEVGWNDGARNERGRKRTRETTPTRCGYGCEINSTLSEVSRDASSGNSGYQANTYSTNSLRSVERGRSGPVAAYRTRVYE